MYTGLVLFITLGLMVRRTVHADRPHESRDPYEDTSEHDPWPPRQKFAVNNEYDAKVGGVSV